MENLILSHKIDKNKLGIPSLSLSLREADQLNAAVGASLLSGGLFDMVTLAISQAKASADASAKDMEFIPEPIPVDLTASIQQQLDDRQTALHRVAADLTHNSYVKGYDVRPWWRDVQDKVNKIRGLDPLMSLTITETSDSDLRSVMPLIPINPVAWSRLSELDKLRALSAQGAVWCQWAHQIGLLSDDEEDIFHLAASLATAVLQGSRDEDICTALSQLLEWVNGIIMQIPQLSRINNEDAFPGLPGDRPLSGDIISALSSEWNATQQKWNEINQSIENAIERVKDSPTAKNIFNLLSASVATPLDAAAAVIGADTQIRNLVQLGNSADEVRGAMQEIEAKMEQVQKMKDAITCASNETVSATYDSPYAIQANEVAAQTQINQIGEELNNRTELASAIDNQLNWIRDLKAQATSVLPSISDTGWPTVQGLSYSISKEQPLTGAYPTSNANKTREAGLASSLLSFQEVNKLCNILTRDTGASNTTVSLYAWFIIRMTVVFESGSSFTLNPSNGLGMGQITEATIATLINKGFFPAETIIKDNTWEAAYQQIRLIAAVCSEKIQYYSTLITQPAVITTCVNASRYRDKLLPALQARYGYYMGYSTAPKTVKAAELMDKQLCIVRDKFDSGDWFSWIND